MERCEATASGAEIATVRVYGIRGLTLDLCTHHFESADPGRLHDAGYRCHIPIDREVTPKIVQEVERDLRLIQHKVSDTIEW